MLLMSEPVNVTQSSYGGYGELLGGLLRRPDGRAGLLDRSNHGDTRVGYLRRRMEKRKHDKTSRQGTAVQCLKFKSRYEHGIILSVAPLTFWHPVRP
jgi:hypothetical protein